MTAKTYIYHITHINNLLSILNDKGLKAKNNISDNYVNIAREGIQSRRMNKMIPVAPYGSLHDYVPFYFAPRSPMLYTLNLSSAIDEGRQNNIIHIVSTIEKVEELDLKYVFTDGHAIMELSEFYNSRNNLNHLDWETIKSNLWNNTEQDPDRKRRKQSEFLVFNFMPINGIIGIGVINDTIKQMTEEILAQFHSEIKVKVCKPWYY